jgi:hypothetical protein
VLYRYGLLAWFWRVLLAIALAGGGALIGFAFGGSWTLVWVALPLLLPAWFFGTVVATRVVRDGEVLHVATLLGWPRRVRLDRLGAPKRYRVAYGETTSCHAPRLWQPVRGTLPLYLDLLATIPDRRAFEQVFGAIPK